jgi:hypothetical protein
MTRLEATVCPAQAGTGDGPQPSAVGEPTAFDSSFVAREDAVNAPKASPNGRVPAARPSPPQRPQVPSSFLVLSLSFF